MDKLSAAARLFLMLALTLTPLAAGAATTLTATPTSIVGGSAVTATWSGIPSPSVQDWVGMYTPGAADNAYVGWRYLDVAAASGSVPYPTMSGQAPGSYQLRLFSNNTYAKLATSNDFTVSVKITGITQASTGSGEMLTGVTFAVTNGGTCASTAPPGQYACAVPPGWSGTITPSLAGYIFTNPPSRNYTNVTTHQAAQHFYAAVAVQVSGTVTVGGSPLAGVAFAANNNGSCTSSNASGQYTCNVPKGWTGTVTPSLAGYSFSPASRNHTNVQWGESGQNFTATSTGSTGTVFYIHPDHLNTPRVITNGAGQAVWRWDQADPFGGNVPNENPSGLGTFTCNLRLPGQYFDKETNLHYNYFRDYDPATGRYPQADPLGITTTPRPTATIGLNHLYAYVTNNPLSLIDPLGLMGVGGGGSAGAQSKGVPKRSSVCGTSGMLRGPEFEFREACIEHDQCFDICGRSKSDCDDAFCRQVKASCSPGDFSCKAAAALYCSILQSTPASVAYDPAQKAACAKGCKQ